METICCRKKSSIFAMDKSTGGCKVCVAGGAGYIGSYLVNKLLEKGYFVHATIMNLDDKTEVALLKSFPNADTRLVLFEADIYNPDQFGRAIEGCEFVFLVATPLLHPDNSKYKNTTEAAIAGAKSIALSSIKSGTVRRLIYTASVAAYSPLKNDGSGYKEFMDETCSTPLDLVCSSSNDFLTAYTDSKTLAEKEILSYNSSDFEVVTLACGLVGGDTVFSYTPTSVAMFVSQITNNAVAYQGLEYLEELLGKVPLVHIDDVCEAHIFCIETPSMDGSFICASSYVSCAGIARYYQHAYPEFDIAPEYLVEPKVETAWNSTKLKEKGFNYKHDTKKILDDSIDCARTMGDLPHRR